MKCLIIFAICLTSLSIYSQEFRGQIYDSENKNPISFVNVGILGENIGTVGDVNGKFKLTLDTKFENDSLRISCIGYRSKSFLIKDLLDKQLNQELYIALKPEIYKIGEVLILGNKPKLIKLGNSIADNDKQKIRTDSLLGSEIGLLIQVPSKNKSYKLKDFTFNLADHDFEAEVRLNVYNIIDSKPSENILRQPIYISIPDNKEILTIDLSEYQILVNDDFFISIENFKGIPSMDKRLKFNGVSGVGDSRCYYRMVSQGNWNKIQYVGVQFKVTAYMY